MKNNEKRYLVEIQSLGCKAHTTVLFSLEQIGGFVYNELRIGRKVLSIQAQEWNGEKWVSYN